MTEPDVRESWTSFLNPDVVRATFVSAGLFLVGHEILTDSIKKRPREFFSYQWDANGPVLGSEYEQEILALDPKGKNDALRGSIAWLQKMGAIDGADEASIRQVTDMRNKIAHEITGMVSGTSAIDFTLYFSILRGLVNKIEKWWIVNVSIATDPDFQGQEIDEASVVPGMELVMDILVQVALGDGDEAWRLHRMFEEQWSKASD